MMKQQSPEFLLGYLFSEIERKIVKDITGRDNCMLHREPGTYVAQIPLLWFGITRPCSSYHTTPAAILNVELVCEELRKKLDSTLSDVFSKKKIHTICCRDKQYMRFVTTVVEDRRKLTVSQIEDLLGYRITIVSEETK